MKLPGSETQEVLSVSHSKFLFSLTGFSVFSTLPCVPFFPLLCIVSLRSSCPLWVSTPPFIQPLITSSFAFIAFTVSARAFQAPWVFIFNRFLLYCLSANYHCLPQPFLVGESLSLFSVLPNHHPWRRSFFKSSIWQIMMSVSGRSLEILFKMKLWKSKIFDVLFLLLMPKPN